MSVGTDDIAVSRRDRILMGVGYASQSPVTAIPRNADSAILPEQCDLVRTAISDERFPTYTPRELADYLGVTVPHVRYHAEGHCSCTKRERITYRECAIIRMAYKACGVKKFVADDLGYVVRTVRTHALGHCRHDDVLEAPMGSDFEIQKQTVRDEESYQRIIKRFKDTPCDTILVPVDESEIPTVDDVEESEENESEDEVQQMVDSVVDGDESETDTLFTNDGGVREDE